MDAFRRLLVIVVLVAALLAGTATAQRTAPLVVDHTSTDLSAVPASAVADAKANLHVAYGHTSHGSQLVSGMAGLTSFTGAPLTPSTYTFNEGGTGGALDLDDYFADGDLGNPDFSSWASRTRTYLNQPGNHDVNVVMWSWCGQVSYASEANINAYLSLMDALERDYPSITFVYMTGHLDGSGVSGNLNLRNNQIRDWCRSHNRVLYDFADIESYDPDGNGYLALGANDACDYRTTGGVTRNWARDWQSTHSSVLDWYACDAAHTESLNANLKAYAAWHLFARLAGWTGTGPAPTPTPVMTPATIPGIVEAEDYDTTGAGNAYFDTTPANEGGAYRPDEAVDIEAIAGEGNGYAICYIREGEWTKYTVSSPAAGIYPVTLRACSWVASPARTVELQVDGSPQQTVIVPNTGSPSAFVTILTQLAIPEGTHAITLKYHGGSMNFDRMVIGSPTGSISLPGEPSPPADLNVDGLYEDLNGNTRADFADVVLYFTRMTWISANEPVASFDYNGNGRIDFADVVWLFNHL